MSLKPIDLVTARKILDFSGGDPALENLAELQLEGTVALHNMIANPKVGMGYLADEVGMGKTYIALGIVSLMRYFNPALRVLYICPSNNVQEKWYSREYRGFCKNNVTVNQYRIRTMDGRPAAPRINCRNVPELINAASTGYYADFFVGMSAFSLALSEEPEQWERKLQELKTALPAFQVPRQVSEKRSVKDKYAAALNYILPTFDLVIIDEAHNFKHNFESSDRNRVLSAVLGFREDGKYISRVKHALLLSATPFDRNINHLRNQLKLVGHEHLLPEDIEDNERTRIESHLRHFLVRRLNELQVAGTSYTRNMYRREWRRGDHAEIRLESDEQKLVTALVQKKVGEVLHRKDGSSSFQTGLLASFESFAESKRSTPVEFDGEVSEKLSTDAQDKGALVKLSRSYIDAGLGRTLPHPKMDIVTRRLAKTLFEQGRKHIVFVRRVKSVKEIKNKLDDHYNNWISKHILEELDGYPEARTVMQAVIREYLQQSRFRDEDISGGEYQAGQVGEAEDIQPPKKDTLFAWFFRGEAPEEAVPLLKVKGDSYTTPEAMRIGLSAKNQVISSLIEINWARAIARLQRLDLDQILTEHGDNIALRASAYTVGATQNDQLELFLASQLGFLDWYAESYNVTGIEQLVNHLRPRSPDPRKVVVSRQRMQDSLETHTFFDALDQVKLLDDLFPLLDQTLSALHENPSIELDSLRTLDIHRGLVALVLRTGHSVIDLYLARLRLGPENLTAATRAAWMNGFAGRLIEQAGLAGFNCYQELHSLANQLDLIIKVNLPEVYDRKIEEYRKFLSQNLNPVAPIIGATGETVSTRSAQARKFRMPGYPLALVSTDVFQEGEDLHTFCDSVMHYGLSGSPVSIEQKTGRVDRVGSKAQRRLLSFADNDDVDDEQLIQVSFPFVRESIEVLQVRQLCQNINAFIESLHEIGGEKIDVQDMIDTETALQDRSAIPEQIRSHLQSPYVPQITRKSPKNNREKFVVDQGKHTSRVLKHVESLLNKRFQLPVLKQDSVQVQLQDGSQQSIAISLRSARASGEILLRAEIVGPEISLSGMKRKQLGRLMAEQSWRTFHRTYVVENANRVYQLHHDAELMVGDENTTHAGAIDRFFERFFHDHDPGEYRRPTNKLILKHWSRASNGKKARYGQYEAGMKDFSNRREIGLTFTFGERGLQRKHHVRIYEVEGRVIFLAQAATPEVVDQLSVDQLVKLTWRRNQNIDIVEFMLDEDMALRGRAIHPVEGLSYHEFVYCAYTLAAATDRLEFLLQVPDVH